MTREQAQLLLPVIEAYAKGKVVQWRHVVGMAGPPWPEWVDYDGRNAFFDYCYATPREWRIKPEPPKPMEWWLCVCCKRTWGPLVSFEATAKCNHCCAALVRVREVLPDEGAREVQP